ncbi:MAG: hypothetical protein R3F49_15380 [Planctomycetota bacterium]
MWSAFVLAAVSYVLAALPVGAPEAPAAPVHPWSAAAPWAKAAPLGAGLDGPRSLALGPTALRIECFAVRRGGADSDPVAVVRWLRLDGAAHTLLEREVVFRAEGWRIHQTERLEGTSRRLTWREQGPTGARSWTSDWDLADASGGALAEVVGYGWRRETHERCAADAPWIGPLEWQEVARAGALADLGAVAWLCPPRALSGRARSSAPSGPNIGPEGRLSFADGAGGAELVEFCLGAPDLVATPLDAVEYGRLAARWGTPPVGRAPAVEAALNRDETLRRIAALFAAGHPVRW